MNEEKQEGLNEIVTTETTKPTFAGLTKKGLVKAILLVGLICFFFPFVTVSCSTEKATMSGAELAFNTSFEKNDKITEEDKVNYYLIAAIGFAAIGILLADTKGMMKAAGVSSLGGALALVLFRTNFVSFYDLSKYEDLIKIEYRWGWFLCLFIFIGAGGIALFLREVPGADKVLSDISNRESINEKVEKTGETVDLSSKTKILREYKALLDEGIITQEEFDAKKKELLG